MDQPSTVQITPPDFVPERFANHIVRRLSMLEGQFHDEGAYASLLEKGDTVVYEVYELSRPEVAGELSSGISIVHSGRVGDEYFMTKGHFHKVIDTAEVYYGLKGHGVMVMETPEGEASVQDIRPGAVLYVPPRWAHRSVNTSDDGDLVTLFVYPAHAGHDYGSIETRGFRKIVVERGHGSEIVDNDRWGGANGGEDAVSGLR